MGLGGGCRWVEAALAMLPWPSLALANTHRCTAQHSTYRQVCHDHWPVGSVNEPIQHLAWHIAAQRSIPADSRQAALVSN